MRVIKQIGQKVIMLILICGLPGTGKSSFSKELADVFSAVHINSDVIRKKIITEPVYSQEEKDRVYAEMVNQSLALLQKGKNVILDATFYQERYRNIMLDTANQAHEKTFILLCTLDEKKIEQRLKQRRSNVSDADYQVYLKLKDRFEEIKEDHLVIDMALSSKERLRAVHEFIGV